MAAFVLKRRVIVAAAGMAVAVVAWYGWNVRTGAVVRTPAPKPTPVLQLAGSAEGKLLREQAEFLDPTPLFFPTPRNFGYGRTIEALGREPSEVFSDFGPSFHFTAKLAAYGLDRDAGPQRPEDLLSFADEAAFAGIGRAPIQFPNLESRAAFLEVKSLITGALVLRSSLKDLSLPQSDFTPVDFLVLVGLNGVIGDPFVTSHSGSEEVDQLLRDFIVKSFRLGERLPPGKYAVSIGR